MPDHQRVVNEVRGVLRSGNLTLTDRVRELADQFKQLCDLAANRLQRCEEYTFLGRRSEAIQLAEAKPPLMEVLAAIGFPERNEWDELTAMYGLAAAPAVDSSRAAAVNSAFAELQPLQSLLRDHRRLNMGKAPAVDRLRVLRKLYEIDRHNPIWPQQMQPLEASQVRAFRSEFDQAVLASNVDKAIAIWTELNETIWINRPKELIDATTVWMAQFHQTRARNNLRQIGRQLQAAMKGRDLTAARESRLRWQEESVLANLGPESEIATTAAEPLEWLTDMELLFSKLNTPDLDGEEIEYQYWLMDRWQKYLPRGLENAYQQRAKQIAQGSAFKERLILGAVCAVGGVALIIFILIVAVFSK